MAQAMIDEYEDLVTIFLQCCKEHYQEQLQKVFKKAIPIFIENEVLEKFLRLASGHYSSEGVCKLAINQPFKKLKHDKDWQQFVLCLIVSRDPGKFHIMTEIH